MGRQSQHALTVKGDLRGSAVQVASGFGIGTLTVGGSLIGEGTLQSGSVSVPGKIGTVKIGRDIQGGVGQESGAIFADAITSVTVGGSLISGGGFRSALVDADTLGAVKIGGDVCAGGNLGAVINANKTVGAIFVGGDLVGGQAGGGAIVAGDSVTDTGNIGSVSVRGSVLGGVGNNSG